MRAMLSPNPSRLGLGFHQHWRLLSSVSFHVALKSFDVAPQRRVLSAISSPVVLTGLGHVLCTGIMGGQGRSVTMSILLDYQSAILTNRTFLLCYPPLMVAAEKRYWQQKDFQGGFALCFVPFFGVCNLQVAIKGGWRRRPSKSRVYCLIPRCFANHVWACALFGLRFFNDFVGFKDHPVANPSLRRKGKKKL